MLSQSQAELLHAAISQQLEKIAALFTPGAKLTLIVRNPQRDGDTSVLMTNEEDIELAIAEIRKRQQTPGIETRGTPTLDLFAVAAARPRRRGRKARR